MIRTLNAVGGGEVDVSASVTRVILMPAYRPLSARPAVATGNPGMNVGTAQPIASPGDVAGPARDRAGRVSQPGSRESQRERQHSRQSQHLTNLSATL